MRNDQVQKVRGKIDELWLKSIRLYTNNTPIARGKYRAYLIALKFCRYLPTESLIRIKDGRKFLVDLTTGTQTSVFFLGEYEKALSEIVIKLLRKGDICLDVGANFGWYTSVFLKYAGITSKIHAFEPVPRTFRELERNYELMGIPENVQINNLALGDRNCEVDLNFFEGLGSGHASLSRQERDDYVSFKCQMITLDEYLETNKINHVNFIKVDIEGAEMMFLKGAEKVFQQPVPPIWLMEMALHQTKNFGYTPNDLVSFLRERGPYEFYRVDETNGVMLKIHGFEPDDIGANVFCIPRGFYEERLLELNIQA